MLQRGGSLAGRCVLLLQLVCGAFALASLLYPLRASSLVVAFPSSTSQSSSSETVAEQMAQQSAVSSVSWEQYHKHCHQPAWEKSSVAVTQVYNII